MEKETEEEKMVRFLWELSLDRIEVVGDHYPLLLDTATDEEEKERDQKVDKAINEDHIMIALNMAIDHLLNFVPQDYQF